LALASLTSGGRSVGIVRLRTSGCGRMCWTFCISDTYATVFELGYPFILTSLLWNTFSNIVLQVCDGFQPLICSPQKSYHCTLLLLGAYRKRSGHTNYATETLQLAGLGRNYPQSRREFVLLPAPKICNAANTTNFKMKHCGNILTHVHINRIQPVQKEQG
jgi:hypothetical protein